MIADLFPEVRSHPEDDTDTRYTPRWFVAQRHAERRFTVDAASALDSPAAQIIGRIWAKADDGLAQSWRGERVWCNPPWSDIAPWVERAWDGGAELVEMLLPAWTDRKWWQRLVEPYRDGHGEHPSGMVLSTRFLPRMAFGHPGNPDAVGVGQPEFWCCLLTWERAHG